MLLLASQTVTGAGTTLGPTIKLPKYTVAAEVELNVMAAATAVGDTLNVYVQSSVDGGTTWDDVISFTQVLGNGGPKKFLARWQSGLSPTAAMAAPQDGALAAGNVAQGPKGLQWRVKVVVAQASAASFTLGVKANVLENR